jgi:hypothetical protein
MCRIGLDFLDRVLIRNEAGGVSATTFPLKSTTYEPSAMCRFLDPVLIGRAATALKLIAFRGLCRVSP